MIEKINKPTSKSIMVDNLFKITYIYNYFYIRIYIYIYIYIYICICISKNKIIQKNK